MMINRKGVYYWKSDRAFASENTRSMSEMSLTEISTQIKDYLNHYFRPQLIHLRPAQGQGNHITFIASYTDVDYFIRLENGPEQDNYMAVESKIMSLVRKQGIPCPKIYLTDVSRSKAPFAIQVMELIKNSDLNQDIVQDRLDTTSIAFEIGRYVAQWQSISTEKFGLFDIDILTESDRLQGYHASYSDYFYLNLDRHLDFLVRANFMSVEKQGHILSLINDYDSLLHIDQGCLVHKDLAFWNIMSDGKLIHAFIDWNDAISGDAVDDLSLLGCFHSGEVVSAAIRGYEQERVLPDNFEIRFWLHLLRNMIFKAVIRVRGNYFDMPNDFFMNMGQKNLKSFTIKRIDSACEGLQNKKSILSL